jgi:hypothetical protein
MTLTAQKSKMVADAISAGFEVRHHETCIDIIKMSRHAKPRVLSGLRVWADGNAFDATIDLSVAKPIRTIKAQRAYLGI